MSVTSPRGFRAAGVAAGQALQCANLALGLPETAGLSASGVAP